MAEPLEKMMLEMKGSESGGVLGGVSLDYDAATV